MLLNIQVNHKFITLELFWIPRTDCSLRCCCKKVYHLYHLDIALGKHHLKYLVASQSKKKTLLLFLPVCAFLQTFCIWSAWKSMQNIWSFGTKVISSSNVFCSCFPHCLKFQNFNVWNTNEISFKTHLNWDHYLLLQAVSFSMISSRHHCRHCQNLSQHGKLLHHFLL